MSQRTTPSARPPLLAVMDVALRGLTAAALAGPRRFEAGRVVRAQIITKTLPVNSAWWRGEAKLDGELLYVAIGDSTAQGIGASAPGRSYVGILADRLRTLTGRSVRVVNLSVSGASVADAAKRQLPKLARLQPDVVTVAIGANDIAHFAPVGFESALRTILEAVPQTALVADVPCFHFPVNERKVRVANEILHRLAAEQGLRVIPLHRITRRQTPILLVTQVAGDLFHPNDRGYRVWASAFLPFLPAVVRALDTVRR